MISHATLRITQSLILLGRLPRKVKLEHPPIADLTGALERVPLLPAIQRDASSQEGGDHGQNPLIHAVRIHGLADEASAVHVDVGPIGVGQR